MNTTITLTDRFKQIAFTARKLTEKFAKTHSSVGEREDLCGFCAIGSVILKELFHKFGGTPEEKSSIRLVLGNYSLQTHTNRINHCWIEYHKTYIVDITATQFDCELPEVYVVQTKHYAYQPLIFHQQEIEQDFAENWSEQSPRHYKRSIKSLINSASLVDVNENSLKEIVLRRT